MTPGLGLPNKCTWHPRMHIRDNSSCPHLQKLIQSLSIMRLVALQHQNWALKPSIWVVSDEIWQADKVLALEQLISELQAGKREHKSTACQCQC